MKSMDNKVYHIYIKPYESDFIFEALAIKPKKDFWTILKVIQDTFKWNHVEIIWEEENFETDVNSWYKIIGEIEDYPEYFI